MKKTVVLLLTLALLLVLTGCVGQKVTVELPANATTGYEWTYEIDDAGVLEFVSEDYEAAGDEPGTPGTQKFVFKTVADGTATITFSYARSWEDEKPANTSVRTYTVSGGKAEMTDCEENLEGLAD